MVVANVQNGQNPAFVELVNKPQASYAYQVPDTVYGPPQDVYQASYQPEEKKGSFLKGFLSTVLVLGALVGLNRAAHSQKWMDKIKVKDGSFGEKYFKTPLKEFDDEVVKYYNKWFKSAEKGSKKAATEGADKGASDAGKADDKK